MKGYLAPVGRPHIITHVPEHMRPLAHAMSKPLERLDLADVACLSPTQASAQWGLLRAMFGLAKHGAGRAGYVRLYYGIDPCPLCMVT